MGVINTQVYPEIESWNEFYPNEIFIRIGENETIGDAFLPLKMANVGATINIHNPNNGTVAYKKIGDIVSVNDLDLELFPLSRR